MTRDLRAFLIKIAIVLALLLITKFADAMTYDEYYDWYVKMKTESIKIHRVLVRRIKQNEGRTFKHLPDINVRYIG